MQITLYTLPTCGICHMIKTKLNQKNIPFIEKDFALITNIINSDRAPALEVIDNNNDSNIYNNPTQIVNWINNYGE